MSISRQLFNEFRPLFRMLEEPLSRGSVFPFARQRSLFDDPFFNSPGTSRPAMDVTEQGNKYIVEADLPGVSKDNVEVRIGDGGYSVTIEGKVPGRHSQAGSDSVASSEQQMAVSAEPTKEVSTERVSSTFSRVFWLPRPVNAEGVKAKMKHGVLTLEIPKDLEKSSVVVPVQ